MDSVVSSLRSCCITLMTTPLKQLSKENLGKLQEFNVEFQRRSLAFRFSFTGLWCLDSI